MYTSGTALTKKVLVLLLNTAVSILCFGKCSYCSSSHPSAICFSLRLHQQTWSVPPDRISRRQDDQIAR